METWSKSYIWGVNLIKKIHIFCEMQFLQILAHIIFHFCKICQTALSVCLVHPSTQFVKNMTIVPLYTVKHNKTKGKMAHFVRHFLNYTLHYQHRNNKEKTSKLKGQYFNHLLVDSKILLENNTM